ncbi:cupin domain-containing protein [Algoriphagus sp. CAU 1675]|nr:cupin domain-containing protein [Algoriphagus sp. CAU 1675]MDF2156241.1 cupin domain-containing protein [Algoriphagus sp. CAU 1675]
MDTQNRIDFLIRSLDLLPHPEGGYYRETYRSEILHDTPSGKRNLSTCIFFLLTSENVSHFHRIKSDELWFWHEGSSLLIHLLGDKGHEILKLGPVDGKGCLPQQLVKAGILFGSTLEDANSYALVSCTVAPGFDFADFELFKAEDLLKDFPDEEEIIRRLT